MEDLLSSVASQQYVLFMLARYSSLITHAVPAVLRLRAYPYGGKRDPWMNEQESYNRASSTWWTDDVPSMCR